MAGSRIPGRGASEDTAGAFDKPFNGPLHSRAPIGQRRKPGNLLLVDGPETKHRDLTPPRRPQRPFPGGSVAFRAIYGPQDRLRSTISGLRGYG